MTPRALGSLVLIVAAAGGTLPAAAQGPIRIGA